VGKSERGEIPDRVFAAGEHASKIGGFTLDTQKYQRVLQLGWKSLVPEGTSYRTTYEDLEWTDEE
jgi:hypothetical protein